MRYANSEEGFDSLLLSTKRNGISNLISWLHTTDFYTAPASTKYHGCEERGLIYHSLTVYDCAKSLEGSLIEADIKIPYDSIVIAALLHDICKVNSYELYLKNVKVTNPDGSYTWEQQPAYKFNEDFKFGGHGSKSVYLASKYINLTDAEAVAINCHMGFSNERNISPIAEAFTTYPLAWLIHVADEMSTFIYCT